jgi:separase
LSPDGKLTFATETINISLKTLSDALKHPQPKKRPRLSSHRASSTSGDIENIASPIKDASTRTLQRSPSLAQRVLKPRSSNASLRPTLSRQESTLSLKKEGPTPGVVAAAECARTGFAYLRAHEKEDAIRLPPWQIENGMLALIGKCLAHGLDAIALKELRCLKRRLDCLAGDGQSAEKKSRTKVSKDAEGKDKETVADLLRFDALDATSGPLLSLAISYQLSILKLLSLLRRPSIIESVAPLLELNYAFAPTNLLLRQAKNSDQTPKVAKQLEGLTQTLFSLSSDDRSSLKPETAFRLQWLALRTRTSWWKLSGHQPNLEKEVWGPFSKCLSAYSRKSTADAQERYELANQFYQDISGALDSYSHSGPQPATLTILRSLSSLAQAAGEVTTAIQWTNQGQSLSVRSRASDAKLAGFSIRLAALSLEAPSPASTTSVQQALRCLNGSLKGDPADLDALLLEVSSLRKAAAKVIIQDAGEESKPLCYEIVFACMRFLRRYMGYPPQVDDTRASLRYGERLSLCRKVMRAFIDSVLLSCKQLASCSDSLLEPFDAALQDCCAFVGDLPSAPHSDIDFHKELGYPSVKASSIYFAYYNIRAKGAGATDVEAVKALRTSIKILDDRMWEERVTGFLAMKLEKLAEVYQKKKCYTEAHTTLGQAMSEYIGMGALRDAAELATSNSLNVVFGTGAPASLHRVAKMMHHLASKLGSPPDQENGLDESTLAPEERAVLLEMRLGLFAQSLTRSSRLESVQTTELESLVEDLLELYDPDQKPLRRQRVEAAILRINADLPDLIEQEHLDTIKKTATLIPDGVGLGDDSGLASFRHHLGAALQATLALEAKPVDIEKLKSALQRWQSIVDSSQTWDALLGHIDNTDSWIGQLQTITDYLDFQGLQSVLIPSLSLLTRVLELQGAASPVLLLATMSRLGVHLVRAGYSGRSGLILAKAGQLLQNTDLTIEARLRHYLARSEYLLAIGATERSCDSLIAAEDVAKGVESWTDVLKSGSGASTQIRQYRLIAEAYHVYSLHCFEIGSIDSAFDFARRACKINQQIWVEMENKLARKLPPSPSNAGADAEMDKLANGMSSLMAKSTRQAPAIISQTHESLGAPAFWSFVPNLVDALMHLANIFAHCGQLQEAEYYMERALRVTDAIQSARSKLVVSGSMANLHLRADRVEKSQGFLDQATACRPKVGNGLDAVRYSQIVSQMWKAREEEADETEVLDQALSSLDKLVADTRTAAPDRFVSVEDELAERITNLNIKPPAKAKKPARTTRAKNPVAKVPTKGSVKRSVQDSDAECSATFKECIPIRTMQGDLLRGKAHLMLRQGNLKGVKELLDQSAAYQNGTISVVQQAIATFRLLLTRAMNEMATDFTFNVLPESTICVPATLTQKHDAKLHGKGTLLSSPRQQLSAKSPLRNRGRMKVASPKNNFVALLQNARDTLQNVQQMALQVGSNSTVQSIHSLLTTVSVILSAVAQGGNSASLHPLTTSLWIGKCILSLSLVRN